jgi:organic radical activating enzyme
MTDLELYITAADYENFRGGDWPTYDDFIKGERSSDPAIYQEIEEFIGLMLKEGIKFPIKTKTACQSKWTWSTIFLNSLSTASCHRVQPSAMTLEEMKDFHNIPDKIEQRKIMLRGEWPGQGCEYCRDIEQAGGWSDRQHNLEIRGLAPPELEHDRTATKITPRLVEIFAQNTCNLACTYCFPELSSRIETENKKFGRFEKGGVTIKPADIPQPTAQYFEVFIEWLEKNIRHLKRLHLLGGETFLQHELMQRVLAVIEKNPNPQLTLCVFSNLNASEKYWQMYINRIHDLCGSQHIGRMELTASIDCWGAEAEYARFGLDLAKFEERLAWASDQDPNWLHLNVNQTITCLTMKTMPELIQKIAHYGQQRPIGHYFQFVTGPAMYQHPKNYAYDFWAETFDRIFDSMPSDTDHQKEVWSRMQGLQKYLQTFVDYNWEEIDKLKIFLDELDRRRKTNWKAIFPYLDISSQKEAK